MIQTIVCHHQQQTLKKERSRRLFPGKPLLHSRSVLQLMAAGGLAAAPAEDEEGHESTKTNTKQETTPNSPLRKERSRRVLKGRSISPRRRTSKDIKKITFSKSLELPFDNDDASETNSESSSFDCQEGEDVLMTMSLGRVRRRSTKTKSLDRNPRAPRRKQSRGVN